MLKSMIILKWSGPFVFDLLLVDSVHGQWHAAGRYGFEWDQQLAEGRQSSGISDLRQVSDFHDKWLYGRSVVFTVSDLRQVDGFHGSMACDMSVVSTGHWLAAGQ
jgi:hypothetical protein